MMEHNDEGPCTTQHLIPLKWIICVKQVYYFQDSPLNLFYDTKYISESDKIFYLDWFSADISCLIFWHHIINLHILSCDALSYVIITSVNIFASIMTEFLDRAIADLLSTQILVGFTCDKPIPSTNSSAKLDGKHMMWQLYTLLHMWKVWRLIASLTSI